MNISELKNQRIRISPHSITCRNENGKTCGVVRNIKQFKTARPAEQMPYFKAIRECGIWGNTELSDCLILVDGKLYYLYNLRPIETYEHFIKGHEGFESDTAAYNRRKSAAEKIAEVATVIPCYVEK